MPATQLRQPPEPGPPMWWRFFSQETTPGVIKVDPFWRDQMMQVYGDFEGFDLQDALFRLVNVITPNLQTQDTLKGDKN